MNFAANDEHVLARLGLDERRRKRLEACGI